MLRPLRRDEIAETIALRKTEIFFSFSVLKLRLSQFFYCEYLGNKSTLKKPHWSDWTRNQHSYSCCQSASAAFAVSVLLLQRYSTPHPCFSCNKGLIFVKKCHFMLYSCRGYWYVKYITKSCHLLSTRTRFLVLKVKVLFCAVRTDWIWVEK